MANPLHFSVELGKAGPDLKPSPGDPLRILYIADLGATSQSRKTATIDKRPIFPVDVDTFETILAREKPSVQLGFRGPSGEDIRLDFMEMEDFHPDQIYRSSQVFDGLKDLRQRFRSPETFDAAARELDLDQAAVPIVSGTGDAAETDAGTMERLFGRKPVDTTPHPGTEPGSFLNNLLREAVASHIAPEADPRAEQYLNAVDTAARRQMRAILHDPAFQSLEAGWRGLEFLVSNVETDEELQIFFLNASKPELADALAVDDGHPEETPLYRRLVEAREDAPFSLIVSDIAFGPHPNDLQVLHGLGVIAAGAGALVLGSATSEVVGADSWNDVVSTPGTLGEPAEIWTSLRTSAAARRITLVAPGFLLRSPYGAKLDPIDAFDFEELVNPAQEQNEFLWGAPALTAAVLISQSFRDNNWNFNLNANLQLNDLPAVAYEFEGTVHLRPCAETLLPDRAAEAVLRAGPVPLLANRDRNSVRLPHFQTISDKAGIDTDLGPFRA